MAFCVGFCVGELFPGNIFQTISTLFRRLAAATAIVECRLGLLYSTWALFDLLVFLKFSGTVEPRRDFPLVRLIFACDTRRLFMYSSSFKRISSSSFFFHFITATTSTTNNNESTVEAILKNSVIQGYVEPSTLAVLRFMVLFLFSRFKAFSTILLSVSRHTVIIKRQPLGQGINCSTGWVTSS